jgi:hypothetical protein
MTRVPKVLKWGGTEKENKSSLAAYTTIFVEDEFKCHDFSKKQVFSLKTFLKQGGKGQNRRKSRK